MRNDLLALLSVDPGSRSSGWAVWERTILGNDDRWWLRCYGLAKQVGAKEIRALIRSLPSINIFPIGCWDLVVEGQWFNPVRGGSHWGAVTKIVESRVTWQVVSELMDAAEIHVVPSSTWIKAATEGRIEKTAPARIKAACRAEWPEIKMHADEYAAVLLGTYWLRKQGAVFAGAAEYKGRR